MKRILAFVHSFAGTTLLALLAWYEAPNGWLAPLWAGFALLLALIDRRFEVEELGWQVPILPLLALGRGFTFNLHSIATWHGWSVRLISLTLVAVWEKRKKETQERSHPENVRMRVLAHWILLRWN